MIAPCYEKYINLETPGYELPATTVGYSDTLIITDVGWGSITGGSSTEDEPVLVGHQLLLSKEPTEWLAACVTAVDERLDMFTLRVLRHVRGDSYCLGDEFELGACALLNLLDTNLTRTGEELAIVETPPAPRSGPTTRYKPGTVDVGWDPGE